MSQRIVESTLGRLLADAEFRHRFYSDPGKTRENESLELTPREIEAMLNLGRTELEDFAESLDARIVRAVRHRDEHVTRPAKQAPATQRRTLR